MQLWIQWWWCVRDLRGACTRQRTFIAMVLVLVGLCVRADLAGVTSFVRAAGLRAKVYHRLLHVFHSDGLRLETLTRLWCLLAMRLFNPVRIGGRIVCLGDGLKVAKEGKKMPGVKKLHQGSQNNSKPEYIMGHSFQALSLLVAGPAGSFAVGMALTGHPPHRSRRAELPHRAPASGYDVFSRSFGYGCVIRGGGSHRSASLSMYLQVILLFF